MQERCHIFDPALAPRNGTCQGTSTPVWMAELFLFIILVSYSPLKIHIYAPIIKYIILFLKILIRLFTLCNIWHIFRIGYIYIFPSLLFYRIYIFFTVCIIYSTPPQPPTTSNRKIEPPPPPHGCIICPPHITRALSLRE